MTMTTDDDDEGGEGVAFSSSRVFNNFAFTTPPMVLCHFSFAPHGVSFGSYFSLIFPENSLPKENALYRHHTLFAFLFPWAGWQKQKN